MAMKVIQWATGNTGTVIVGLARADATVQFAAVEFPVNEKRLLGSLYGSAEVRRDFNLLLRLWRAGRLDLEGMITRRIELDQVNEGIAACERCRIASGSN